MHAIADLPDQKPSDHPYFFKVSSQVHLLTLNTVVKGKGKAIIPTTQILLFLFPAGTQLKKILLIE